MQSIHCRAIIEMLGAPKDYIEKTLRNYVQKLKNDGKAIIKEHYEEAAPQEGGMFATFCELELNFTKPKELITFCFESMPSSIEIIEPEALAISNHDLTNFLNDLQAHLHEADMIVKTLHAQQQHLDTNATHVFYNFITHILKNGPKTKDDLALIVGMPSKDLLPFLNQLIEKERIREENGTYYSNE